MDENNLFKVVKPNIKLGIGVDSLPLGIRNSKTLTGNHLGQLANVSEYPVFHPSFDDEHLRHIMLYYSTNPQEMETEIHIYAAHLLDKGQVEQAWQVLLSVI